MTIARPSVLAVIALAACTPPQDELFMPSTDALCGAEGMRDLVGQPASVLDGMVLPADTRIVRPGMAVTMDYRPDRLNIDLDEDDRILRLSCG